MWQTGVMKALHPTAKFWFCSAEGVLLTPGLSGHAMGQWKAHFSWHPRICTGHHKPLQPSKGRETRLCWDHQTHQGDKDKADPEVANRAQGSTVTLAESHKALRTELPANYTGILLMCQERWVQTAQSPCWACCSNPSKVKMKLGVMENVLLLPLCPQWRFGSTCWTKQLDTECSWPCLHRTENMEKHLTLTCLCSHFHQLEVTGWPGRDASKSSTCKQWWYKI